MSIDRTNFNALVDDDGSNTLGTVWNKTQITSVVLDPIDTAISNRTCEGRLTLTASTPVTTSDVTAATTLRFTPFQGNRIALYDGSTYWKVRTFTELTIAVPATTSQLYDVFVYDNSGTATLELLAWTNDTTRATALTTQDGILVKTGATTRRYVGSFRTTTVSGQTEDSAAKRFVWNYTNRARRSVRVLETTDSWPYTTATIRQANGSTANQVAVVVGVAEAAIELHLQSMVSNSGANVQVLVVIGEDSTTTKAANCLAGILATGAAGLPVIATAHLVTYPAVGYHFYAWLEFSTASGTTTWYGDNGGTTAQSGLAGVFEG